MGGQLRRQQAEEQRGKETALASLLTLTPHYFPAELYSSSDQRRALLGSPLSLASCRFTRGFADLALR